MTRISVFVSSPGDVAEERALAARVLGRLEKEFAGQVALNPVFWEHEPLTASATFQDQLIRPSQTDIVVCILWSRLGTRLPAQYTREDGSRFESGTEFEFEDALAGFQATGRPHLLVYRKTAEPLVSLQDAAGLLEKLRQKEALDAFIDRWFHDRDDGTLRAAFHPFATPDVFEEALTVHLRKMIRRMIPSTGRGDESSSKSWTKGSPFRGLEAFDVEHADVFFGRTRHASEVLDRLRAQDRAGRPFVLILGMSGGGKSSLARAGVLSMLTRPGVVEGVETWFQCIAKPSDAGSRPMAALARALTGAGIPRFTSNASEVESALSTAPVTLAREVHRALAETPGPGAAKLVVLLDQVEELFTNPDLTREERDQFARAVRALVEEGVWMLATMRSDLYPRLQETPDFLFLKEGLGQYDLAPPTPTELVQMIRQPVLAAGLKLEFDPSTGASLEELLRDAAAGHPASLPLLEFTLEELYRTRGEDGTLTLDSFRKMGGVEGSLARRAEEVFDRLPEPVRRALPEAMRHLVTVVDGPEGTAVGAGRADLAALGANSSVRDLVDALVTARLLTTDLTDKGNAVVRIAHEALLRHWPRLRDWIEEDQEILKTRTRLRGAAFRWAEEGKREEFLLAQGKPLVDAQSIVEAGVSLSSLEEAYLSASEFRARRFVRLRRGAIGGMVLLSLLAVGAALVARDQAALAEREAYAALRVQGFMVGLLDLASPKMSRGEDVTVTEVLDWGGQALLQGQLQDTPGPRARAARSLATLQLDLGGSDANNGQGGYERALALVRLADSIQSSELPARDSTRAATWTLMGEVHNALAHYDSAAHYLEGGAQMWSSVSGAKEAEALGLLANVRHRQGRRQEYFSLMNRATDLALTTLDTTSADFASALTNHGNLLIRAERFADAETVLERAAGIWRRVAMSDDPQYGEFMGFLAQAAAAQGRYQTADSLWESALEIERRVLPEGHEGLAMTLNNAALNAQIVGDTARSEAYLREALRLAEAALGEGHNRVAQVRNNLAELLIHRPETREESDALFQQAIGTLTRTNPGSSDLSAALQNYAEALRISGRLDEGIPYLDEAIAVDRRAGRVGETSMAEMRRGLFELYRNDRDAATGFFSASLATAASIEDRLSSARRLAVLQQILWQFDQVVRAEEAARLALAVLETAEPGPHLARALGDMAFWHSVGARPDSAALLLDDALEILDATPPPIGSLWLEANQSVRDALSTMERHQELVARDRRVLETLKAEEADPEWVLLARFRLAHATKSAGDEREGRRLLTEMVRDATGLLGAEHPLTQEALLTLESW